MRRDLILPLAFACIAALPPPAGSAPARSSDLDPARIHADYQAGEFEKVIRALEAFRESGRRCRKADSVFLEKHLAVVYAAAPKTRERGRYHMLRMLALDPEADLLDMFVGEEVDGIFEKVRKESRVQRMARVKARAAKPSQAPKAAAPGKAIVAPAAGLPPNPWSPSVRPAASAETVSAVPRPAFRDPGPAPRLKPWNLGEDPAPRRAPRKAGAARAAAARETDAAPGAGASMVGTAVASRASAAKPFPKARGNPQPRSIPASALPAWDLDRTASSGPAMGVLPAAKPMAPSKPAALAIRPARLTPIEASEVGNPFEEDRAEAAPGAPGARWKDKGFWVGGTAVAAVLGLTVYYVGSQDWSEPASKSRTYGVAAKPANQ